MSASKLSIIAIVSFVVFLVQWGSQLLGLTNNIFWGWVLLIIAYGVGVWAFFMWHPSRPLSLKKRIILSTVVGFLYFGLFIYCYEPQKQPLTQGKLNETLDKIPGLRSASPETMTPSQKKSRKKETDKGSDSKKYNSL